MKDLNALYKEGRQIVAECIGEDKILDIDDVSVNYRAKTRWGQCKYNRKTGKRSINISHRILADSVPHDAVLSTVVHEILHACKDGHSHTGAWKRYAAKVMKEHPELSITRTTDYTFFGLEEPINTSDNSSRSVSGKYVIVCERCGYKHYSSRMSRSIQHPEYYRHKGCGGRFKHVY